MKIPKRGPHKIKNEPKPFSFLPSKYEHAVLISLILLSFIIFFHEALLENKIFIATDIISPTSRLTYEEEIKERGEFPLWNPFIFGGMPGFASFSGGGGDRWYDFTTVIYNSIQAGFKSVLRDNDVFRVVFRHLLLAIALYVFINYKVKNRWAAFFGALSFSFGIGVIKWITAGHAIKSMSFAIFPILLLFAEQFRHKIKIWQIVVFTLCLGIGFSFYHIQMYYYTYFGLGIYFIFFFVREIKKKDELLKLLRSGVVIVLCSGFAFLMSADRFFSMLEYNPYSIRGAAPITEVDKPVEERRGALDYDYATSWSFSIEEITTFIVPSFYGFGNQFYEGPLSDFRKVKVNTYFGQMPFTEAPLYMGAVLLLFAVIGAVCRRRDPFVMYLIILSTISLLISFGRNFPILYDLMYHYAPFFSSFRVPSMILILTHTSIAILAAYGLSVIIDMPKENRVLAIPGWLKKSLIGAGILFGLSLIARPLFESSYISLIESSGTRLPAQLFPWMYEQMINDFSFTLGFLLLSFGVIALYLRKSMSSTLLISSILLLSIIDLWRIAYRPMEMHPSNTLENLLQKDDGIEFIKNDEDIFRAIEIRDGRPLTDNRLQYFLIQNVSGYHAAKMRSYQDLIDVAGITNPFVMNLLNVKYLISDRFYEDEFLKPVFDGNRKVMENVTRMPRAWLVDSVKVVPPIEILHTIRDAAFDPGSTAFIEEPLELMLDKLGTGSSIHALIWDYHTIKVELAAEGAHLLVFSEIHYPPGWHAYLNGEKTDIIKTNYFMRGVIIPPGEHLLELKFHSRSYERGKLFTLTTNLLILSIGFGSAVTFIIRKQREKKGMN